MKKKLFVDEGDWCPVGSIFILETHAESNSTLHTPNYTCIVDIYSGLVLLLKKDYYERLHPNLQLGVCISPQLRATLNYYSSCKPPKLLAFCVCDYYIQIFKGCCCLVFARGGHNIQEKDSET